MGFIKLPKESEKFFLSNLKKVFKSGNLAEGKWNKSLEKIVVKITKGKGAVNFCSNGAGLMTVFQILKKYYGRDTILIQNNTMYGMYSMPISSGLKIGGFIKCNLETLMPNYENFLKSINHTKTPNEKLIVMLSHMGGIINPDIIKIANFCRKKKIFLIEDCAHSFGSTFKGKHSGLFGDAGVYSFYATKSIPAGEGGVMVSKNLKLLKLAARYTKYDRFEQRMNIGVNFRISEVQALLIYSAVINYKKIINDKRKIYNIYSKFCKKNKVDFIDQCINGNNGNHYKFVIYNKKIKIKNFLKFLRTKTSGIYDYALDNSKYIPEHHVCLPIWYNQKKNIANKVIAEIKNSLRFNNKAIS